MAVACLSISVKIVLDVALEGYNKTNKKFKFNIERTNILLGKNRHLQSAKGKNRFGFIFQNYFVYKIRKSSQTENSFSQKRKFSVEKLYECNKMSEMKIIFQLNFILKYENVFTLIKYLSMS